MSKVGPSSAHHRRWAEEAVAAAGGLEVPAINLLREYRGLSLRDATNAVRLVIRLSGIEVRS